MPKSRTCPTFPHKIVHRTRDAAQKALTSLERGGLMDQFTQVYPCGDHFHLGHRRPPSRDRQIANTLAIGRAKAKARQRRRR